MWAKALFAFICLVCLFPLFVAGALLISAKRPSLDGFTQHMPQFWRRSVSEEVYWEDFSNTPASHAAMERAVRLDPTNLEPWKRRCLWAGSTGDLRKDVWICENAAAAELHSPLVIAGLARAQMSAGDACAAQHTYEKAISLDDNQTHYADLESMAHAALQCGDRAQAIRGLKSAIRVEEQNRAGQRLYSGSDDSVAQKDEAVDSALLQALGGAPQPQPVP